MANTKTTLINLENRLQAAVSELQQFKHIKEEGLIGPKKVIAKVCRELCTLKNIQNNENWFFEFVVDIELSNLKKAKNNITRALKGVHIQHIALLEMINSALSSGTEESSSSTMNVSPCGRFVRHPVTKMLIKIEEGDTADTTALLQRIDENKSNMFRARLQAMRIGRQDLRASVFFGPKDINTSDIIIKFLRSALANTSATYNQPQKSENKFTELLPFKKSISYIPVALENKKSLLHRECDVGRGSVISDTDDKTHRFLDQQEAHDLSSIINILSKHRFGEYNQASIISLFNKSQLQSIESVPPQVPVNATPHHNMEEYVANVAPDLLNTAEYIELSSIYDDMDNALNSSRSLKTLSFFVNPQKMGEFPKANYETIKIVSEMKQLKSSAIKKYTEILSTLENYDPSLASKTSISTVAHPDSSVFEKLESASIGGTHSIKDAMNRETAIRIALLMHHKPFLDMIQDILKMITQYFKNIDELNNTIIHDEAKQVSENQIEILEKHLEEYKQTIIPNFNKGVVIHKEEIKAIRTEIDTLNIKINEVNNILFLYTQQLESISDKLNTGTNDPIIIDLMKITDDSQQMMKTINDLKEFAEEHEDVVYQVPEDIDIESDEFTHIIRNIGVGQNMLKVSFKDTMARFPKPVQEFHSNDDIKLFIDDLRKAHEALENYKTVLTERITLLEERAIKSEVETDVIEKKNNRN